MREKTGFSLLELLVTLTIVSVLIGMSIPLYSHYIEWTKRLSAIQRLGVLAKALEDYYFQHQTYQGANFHTLHFDAKAVKSSYRLLIPIANHDGFLIAAKPIRKQALRDTTCGTLFLNAQGEKTISGKGPVENCW